MIRYLGENEKYLSESLYREAFPEDKDEFVNYYYSYVTRDNRILVVEEAGQICSMLHLNPYRISVNGQAVDAYYYVAVATTKNCRHQGMMRSLLQRSLQDIHTEGHPFAYLMPVNRAIYEPFGFRIVYEQTKAELPQNPDEANEKMAELFDVYTIRDAWYVEKMLEEERVCAGEEPFDIVPYMMMRITDVKRMLSLLRSSSPLELFLHVTDEIIPENDGFFELKMSETESVCRRAEEKDCTGKGISVNIAELTEFVFGKRRMEGLEKINPLKRICINEAV